jgi:2-polyprenyl-6-methoxyphenol hydroxylase-like FAD-dependent oxidoreductase
MEVSMSDHQVLIVGAGPTGLVLALWLTKSGIPVRIIDKTDSPGTTSRALVFHARNLEFYHQLGIDRIAIERGIEFKAANLWLRGRRVGGVSFGDIGTAISPYPYALIFPQDLHEQMLVEQLESLGVHVERGTELINFAQAENETRAELKTKTGEEEICRVAYIAGCDGAHSIVREKLGVGFPGGTYVETYYVADILGSGSVINGELSLALDDADFLAIFPMKGEGRIRLVGTVRQDVDRQQELRWEDVSQTIIHHLKLNVEEVKWFSNYRVHHRVAAHFQQGNVFLLGDAAHIHSPVGGQGMNTGIGDAVNLAWKLAAVIKGASPGSLLETYEPERIAFARRLVATTDRAFAFVNARGPIATQVRTRIVPWLLPFLFRFTAVRRLMFQTISQTQIKYPNSPLSHGPAGTVQGGQRLPWIQFEDANGNRSDNFTVLSMRQWQVHRYGDVASELQVMCDDRGLKLHIFPWNAAANQAGLRRNAAYVIRPDGHVAIADLRADPISLAAYFDRWLKNARADSA